MMLGQKGSPRFPQKSECVWLETHIQKASCLRSRDWLHGRRDARLAPPINLRMQFVLQLRFSWHSHGRILLVRAATAQSTSVERPAQSRALDCTRSHQRDLEGSFTCLLKLHVLNFRTSAPQSNQKPKSAKAAKKKQKEPSHACSTAEPRDGDRKSLSLPSGCRNYSHFRQGLVLGKPRKDCPPRTCRAWQSAPVKCEQIILKL